MIVKGEENKSISAVDFYHNKNLEAFAPKLTATDFINAGKNLKRDFSKYYFSENHNLNGNN